MKLLKPLFLSLLLSCSACVFADTPSQAAVSDLSRYDDINVVENIFANEKVIGQLKALLGSHYAEFIMNFDAVGEPHMTPEGGLFVEGWLEHLRLEQASAFVIQPDGRIYAAWKKPDTDKIDYRSSEGDSSMIQRELAQWAARFEHMTFTDE